MIKSEIFILLKKAYEKQMMFESILFEGTSQKSLEEIAQQVSRFFYCDQHQFIDDGCSSCKKFNHDGFLDYVKIGDGLLAINKESLKTTLTEFATSAKEFGKPKILIIANAENLKTDAANSLLKFLEEPTSNTYLILLTKNRNEVLPTIKSRTKILTIDSDLETVQENILVTAIKNKNRDTILLLNNKFKKMNKEELIVILEQALNHFLELKALKIYELSLNLINDLRFGINNNLAIDNFLIEATGEQAWKF